MALDFNRDGKLDLAYVTFFPTNDYNIHVLLGNGDGTFQPDVVSPGSKPVAIGDFNGDGKLDFAGVYSSTIVGNWFVLLGNGDGSFSSAGQEPPISYTASNVVVGDFNRDGKLDAAIPNADVGILVFLGNGSGVFQNSLATTTGPIFYEGAVGDFNGDGKLDLIGMVEAIESRTQCLRGYGTPLLSRNLPAYDYANPPIDERE